MEMKTKIYPTIHGDLDLSRIVRLYPAVVVDMHGERAEMSLEWVELYGEKVKLLSYILVFDFTAPKEEQKDRVVLEFASKEDLLAEMQKVSQFFHD